MRIKVLASRELKSYISSPAIYIIAAVFLVLSGSSFVMYLRAVNYSDTSIRGFIDTAQFLVLLFAAVLSMRVIAEEKKTGTWELILTSPISDFDIILAKFVSSLVVLICILIITLYYPLFLILFGDPDMGPILTGYAGLFLLGSASLAIGIFASSVSGSQIVSAVLAIGMLFGLWFLGMAASVIGGPLGEVAAYLSLSEHFNDFSRGILDTRHIIYYVSVTIIFLFLSVRSIEMGRWR